MQEGTAPVWERMAGEPGVWYARFEIFRLLGPTRTLARAYRTAARLEGLRGKRPSRGWTVAAREWKWVERAEAWDQEQREWLRAIEEDRRFDAREHRLQMINRLLEMAFNVLLAADMEALDTEKARSALPTLRVLFKDLIAAQRAELGLPVVGKDADAAEVHFTADDLSAAEKELEDFRLRILDCGVRGSAAGTGSEGYGAWVA